MPQYSVDDIIKIGDISTYLSANYIEQGKIYGDRMSQDMDTTIAMVTDALRWQWAAFPDVAEVRAVGRVTIDQLGDDGDNIAVYVNDPDYGIIQLGNKTEDPSDTTTTILAGALSNNCSLNSYGYQIIWSGSNYFTIIGREGAGAGINNSNNLFLVITPTPVEFISTELDIRLVTQQPPNPNYITTETY
jgi:hypothetical protein